MEEENRLKLLADLQERAGIIRRDILDMIYVANSGHPGGSLSAADICTALYFHCMKIDPANPGLASRDRFILSKGHACPVWYACLAERDFLPLEELLTLRSINGRLQGHPDMSKTPGIDMTTGSLGQGLSAAVGMALALRQQKEKPRVFVLLGDGELNEGQIWEAAMAAAKFGLDNLVSVIDYNNLQLDGYCHDVMPIEPLIDKWRAFGWHCQEINGHDMADIVQSLDIACAHIGQPSIIIAHTIKGKGISFMEDVCAWHGKAPSPSQYAQAIEELGVQGHFARETIEAARALSCMSERKPMHQSGIGLDKMASPTGNMPRPTRDACGEALVEIGLEYRDVVVLEADISTSTRTCFFAERFPDRFFQFGVAESNMMTAAAGMATAGKRPFVSTYAVFASMRACEQVRTSIAYPNLNVKIAASHGGITSANDGVTHQGTEDMGIMRTIPNMTVIMPADFYAAKALIQASLVHEGPVYLRFSRDPVPIIYGEDEEFQIGRGKLLRTGGDISLIAIGDMLSIALNSAEQLYQMGYGVDVIDMHTIKPLDEELILETARRTRRVVTLEDHQIQGGLGSAVAEVLSERFPTPMRRIGLQDTFAESGKYSLLLDKYGMGVDAIVSVAKELIEGGC